METCSCTLRGRRGTYGTGLALVARLVSVAPRRFAWQAWHLATCSCTLSGTHSTWRHVAALCVAVVALMALGWLWGRLVLGVAAWRRGVLRGRRGTWRYPPSLCVAGVALGDIHRHFAWQAWHAWHWAGSGGALGFRCGAVAPRRFAWQAWHLTTCSCFEWQAQHLETCSCTLRGRRGTYGTGVALVARLVLGVAPWRRGVLHGRRGTWRHVAAL